jgi:hypothetical protein
VAWVPGRPTTCALLGTDMAEIHLPAVAIPSPYIEHGQPSQDAIAPMLRAQRRDAMELSRHRWDYALPVSEQRASDRME